MAFLGGVLGGPVLGVPVLGTFDSEVAYTQDVTINVDVTKALQRATTTSVSFGVTSGISVLKGVGYFSADVGVSVGPTVTTSAGYSHDATIGVDVSAVKDGQLVYGKNIDITVRSYFEGATTPDDQAGVLGGAVLAVPVLGVLDLDNTPVAGVQPKFAVTRSETYNVSVANLTQINVPLSFTFGIDVTKTEQNRTIGKFETFNLFPFTEVNKGMAPTFLPVTISAAWNEDAFSYTFSQQTYTDTDILQLPVNVVLAHKYLFKKHGKTVEHRDPNYKFERMASRRTGVRRLNRGEGPSFTTTTNKKGYD